jgi:hypothetical protein
VRFAIGEGGMSVETNRLVAVTVVPAKDGTYLLIPIISEPGTTRERDVDEGITVDFERAPVIAWRVMSYKGICLDRDEEFPVVLGGMGDAEEGFILLPDGRVWSYSFDRFFPSVSDCLKYVQRIERRTVATHHCACGEC